MERIHADISQGKAEIKSDIRDQIDLLCRRMNLLAGKDRLLMTMYLKNGNSFRQMARLTGVNEASIARRIHKVTKRLIDSEYITCLRNRDKFTSIEMAIAKDYFLLGLSIREVAKKRTFTYYCVQTTLKKIRRLVAAIQERRLDGQGQINA